MLRYKQLGINLCGCLSLGCSNNDYGSLLSLLLVKLLVKCSEAAEPKISAHSMFSLTLFPPLVSAELLPSSLCLTSMFLPPWKQFPCRPLAAQHVKPPRTPLPHLCSNPHYVGTECTRKQSICYNVKRFISFTCMYISNL